MQSFLGVMGEGVQILEHLVFNWERNARKWGSFHCFEKSCCLFRYDLSKIH